MDHALHGPRYLINEQRDRRRATTPLSLTLPVLSNSACSLSDRPQP